MHDNNSVAVILIVFFEEYTVLFKSVTVCLRFRKQISHKNIHAIITVNVSIGDIENLDMGNTHDYC